MGLNFTACAPRKYQPDAALVEQCRTIAAETGAAISFEEDPAKAAKGADVLYTDVWVSMGEPVEVWAERINDLAAYQINQQLMDIAGPKAVFMHCLPAYHDHKTTVGREMGERFGRDAMEVTDEVFEGPQSIVFDEAENRMHTIKPSWRPRWAITADGRRTRFAPRFRDAAADPAHPLTEFYCLLQRALDREGVFALPALYAQFRAPARRIYADEAADFLTLLPDEEEGASRLLAPAQLQLLYSSLHVMPDGAPAALLLTEECTRTVYAVQLLPPFVWEDPLPPLPDAPAALSLTLTMRDVEEIDACPAALGHRLACDKAGKRWLHHPRAETYLSERVALFQRLYR